MKLLEGKAALITGGSRGIGRSMVLEFARQGANVGFTYLSSDAQAAALEAEASALGVKAKAYKSDAANYAAAEALVNDFVKEFGTLDILVNNAGITKDGLLMRMSEDQFNDVIKTNLNSVFNMTKAATRPLMKQKSGSIINMTSVVGVRGNAGQANYAASKAGIIGFTKSVALEIGSRNIRCNAIAPGFIETEMTAALDPKTVEEWQQAIPMKRAGKSDEVAQLAVFLGSDMSKYITGQVVEINGGMNT